MFRFTYSKPLSHLSGNSISAQNAERDEAPRYLKKNELVVCELDVCETVHRLKYNVHSFPNILQNCSRIAFS